MKKHVVVFKNGRLETISHEMATAIRDALMSGTKSWQCFSDKDNNVFFIINMLEIAYIIDSEYIAPK